MTGLTAQTTDLEMVAALEMALAQEMGLETAAETMVQAPSSMRTSTHWARLAMGPQMEGLQQTP